MGSNQVDVQIGGEDVNINQSTFYALRILYRLDERRAGWSLPGRLPKRKIILPG